MSAPQHRAGRARVAAYRSARWRAWRAVGSALAREFRADLAARIRQLAAAFAAARHAARRADQREPAAHVLAVVRVQVGEYTATVRLHELGAGIMAPIAPGISTMRPA